MSLHCLELCEFREDPFALVPKHAAKIWVERNATVVPDKVVNLREYLLKICKSPIFGVGSGVTEFTSICGDLGSGKSHTLIHISSYIKQMYPDVIVVYLPTVQVASKTNFCNVFFETMKKIGIKELSEISEKLTKTLEVNVQNELKGMSKPELLKLQELASKQNKSVHDLVTINILEQNFTEDYEAINLVAALSYFKESPNEVFDWLCGKKKLDFTWKGMEVRLEKISTDYEAEKTLANFINTLLAIRNQQNIPVIKAFILMIDQFDLLARFPSSNWNSVTHHLSLLFREVPEGFALLTGFMGDATELEAIAGPVLSDVLTSPPIWLEAFNDQEAADFLVKLLQAYRKEGSDKPASYPFKEEAIREIVNRTINKIPRKLIESARKVFYYACGQGILDQREIGASDVQAVL